MKFLKTIYLYLFTLPLIIPISHQFEFEEVSEDGGIERDLLEDDIFAVSSDNQTYLVANNNTSITEFDTVKVNVSVNSTNSSTAADGGSSNNAINTANNVSTLSPTLLTSTQSSVSSSHAISTTESTVDTSQSPPLKTNPDTLCLCDLRAKVCDWNCCCDLDCIPEAKLLFSTCEGSNLYDTRSPGQRERSCFKSYLFYTHNTPEMLQRSKSGLFCIVKDNNPEETELQISKSDLQKRIRKVKPKYLWNLKKYSGSVSPANFYKYEDVILSKKYAESSEFLEKEPFTVPAAYFGRLCTVKAPVQFLQDFHSRCTVQALSLNEDCSKQDRLNANIYIENTVILSNPTEESDEIKIRKAICNSNHKNPKCKEEAKIPIPSIDEAKGLCRNILHRMNITIAHNGIHGIVDVIAKSELKDFPLSTTEIYQEFQINFIWKNITNITDEVIDVNVAEWPRSGNPGYIVGKPVIMGEKVHVDDSANVENYDGSDNKNNSSILETNDSDQAAELANPVILLSKDPSQWMTVLNPGDCDLNIENPKRRSVLFGLSHSSTCKLKSSSQKYCVDLKLMIGRILLGTEHPETFHKLQKHVAAFGNANHMIPSEWVPVTLENYHFYNLPQSRGERPPNSQLVTSGCDNIVSMLHIQISFAHVGSVDFPQAKILNVLYEFGEPYSFPKKALCKTNCHIDNFPVINVRTVITFIDTTSRPITKVAKWPIVSLKLPSDFFYPFTSPTLSSGAVAWELNTLKIMTSTIIIQSLYKCFVRA